MYTRYVGADTIDDIYVHPYMYTRYVGAHRVSYCVNVIHVHLYASHAYMRISVHHMYERVSETKRTHAVCDKY